MIIFGKQTWTYECHHNFLVMLTLPKDLSGFIRQSDIHNPHREAASLCVCVGSRHMKCTQHIKKSFSSIWHIIQKVYLSEQGAIL